jgi:hypothetical protein
MQNHTKIEDMLEQSFWDFDAARKGYGDWKNRPQSERDAFKQIVRQFVKLESQFSEVVLAPPEPPPCRILREGCIDTCQICGSSIKHNWYGKKLGCIQPQCSNFINIRYKHMAIDINKRVASVGIVLEKRKMNNIPCQVKLCIDKSGSMQNLYNDGTVQDVVERVLAISLKVDQDGTVDVFAFHNKTQAVKAVTLPLMENYVKKEIEDKMGWGGTSYAPAFEAIVNSSKGKKGLFGFGAKPADPTLAIFITDGENDDAREAEKVIKDSQSENIYWLLMGIGSANFRFIEQLGDKYPNAGFVPVNDISAIDDDDLFEAMLNEELATWFQKFKK